MPKAKIVVCLLLSLTGLFFGLVAPSRAGDAEILTRGVHAQLIQAETAAAPTDQQTLLAAALDALKAFPPSEDKANNKKIKKAEGTVKAAIEQIKLGDPDHLVKHLIEDADSIVRDME